MVRRAIHPRKSVDQRYYVEAAARTIKLLRAMAIAEHPLGLTELATRLAWAKPTVYRLLRTLEVQGAVRAIEQQRYVLGPALITLGQAALEATVVPAVAEPHLQSLYQQLEENVSLAVLDDADIVYLARVEARQILAINLHVGSRLPAYCTSMGQVLLAGLSDEEVEERLADVQFEQHASNTILSMSELLARLTTVRDQGFAINDEEIVVGHRSAGAPLRDHTGGTVAAVNVSVPAARVSLEMLRDELVPLLVATAQAISTDLGAAEL